MLSRIPEAAQTLLRAADIIRESGWWDGRNTEPVCAALACEAASPTRYKGEWPSLVALCHYLEIDVPMLPEEDMANYLWEVIPAWNDAPERTADEVIADFEGAATRRVIPRRQGTPHGRRSSRRYGTWNSASALLQHCNISMRLATGCGTGRSVHE